MVPTVIIPAYQLVNGNLYYSTRQGLNDRMKLHEQWCDPHWRSDYHSIQVSGSTHTHCAFHLSPLSSTPKGSDPTMALYWRTVLGAVPLGCTAPGLEPAPPSVEGWHTLTASMWAIWWLQGKQAYQGLGLLLPPPLPGNSTPDRKWKLARVI